MHILIGLAVATVILILWARGSLFACVFLSIPTGLGALFFFSDKSASQRDNLCPAAGRHLGTALLSRNAHPSRMTATERRRLARILGMLGSEHAGERASAALQAEAFRKRHNMTWEQMLAPPPIVREAAAAPPEPPPPPPRKRSPFGAPPQPKVYPFVPPADATIGIDGGKVRALLYVVVMIGGAILVNVF